MLNEGNSASWASRRDVSNLPHDWDQRAAITQRSTQGVRQRVIISLGESWGKLISKHKVGRGGSAGEGTASEPDDLSLIPQESNWGILTLVL